MHTFFFSIIYSCNELLSLLTRVTVDCSGRENARSFIFKFFFLFLRETSTPRGAFILNRIKKRGKEILRREKRVRKEFLPLIAIPAYHIHEDDNQGGIQSRGRQKKKL